MIEVETRLTPTSDPDRSHLTLRPLRWEATP